MACFAARISSAWQAPQVSGRFSAKVEVLGYDLSDVTVRASDPVVFPGQTIDYSFDNSGVVARIGLNYGF